MNVYTINYKGIQEEWERKQSLAYKESFLTVRFIGLLTEQLGGPNRDLTDTTFTDQLHWKISKAWWWNTINMRLLDLAQRSGYNWTEYITKELRKNDVASNHLQKRSIITGGFITLLTELRDTNCDATNITFPDQGHCKFSAD